MQTRITTMAGNSLNPKSVPVVLFLVAVLLFTPHTISASDSGTGLVTKIEGRAEYMEESSGKFSQADVFMKIRNGDRIKIHENSQITIIFQMNGQRETWFGPAVIKAGDSGCLPENGNPPRQAIKEKMPVGVSSSDKIFAAPEKFSEMLAGRGGVRIVRATGGNESRLRKDMADYDSMKKKFGNNDISADLFLLSVYSEYNKKIELGQLLDVMLKKWPDNPYIKKWNSRFHDKM